MRCRADAAPKGATVTLDDAADTPTLPGATLVVATPTRTYQVNAFERSPTGARADVAVRAQLSAASVADAERWKSAIQSCINLWTLNVRRGAVAVAVARSLDVSRRRRSQSSAIDASAIDVTTTTVATPPPNARRSLDGAPPCFCDDVS